MAQTGVRRLEPAPFSLKDSRDIKKSRHVHAHNVGRLLVLELLDVQ
jgi:hypothetical protein